MKNPYKARVDARSFLNLPGYHDGAYVVVYVEDTSERGLEDNRYGGEKRQKLLDNAGKKKQKKGKS